MYGKLRRASSLWRLPNKRSWYKGKKILWIFKRHFHYNLPAQAVRSKNIDTFISNDIAYHSLTSLAIIIIIIITVREWSAIDWGFYCCSVQYVYFVPYAYETSYTHMGYPMRIQDGFAIPYVYGCPIHVWH